MNRDVHLVARVGKDFSRMVRKVKKITGQTTQAMIEISLREYCQKVLDKHERVRPAE